MVRKAYLTFSVDWIVDAKDMWQDYIYTATFPRLYY